jgi:HEAT repeat protein
VIEADHAGIVDKYMAALRHPQAETRLRAAWLLGQMQAARAVPALLALVAARSQADYDPYLLSAAVKSLGQIGDQRAVPELAALLSDASVSILARKEAIEALARLGGDAAQAALARALADPHPSVRERVRQILNAEKEIELVSG